MSFLKTAKENFDLFAVIVASFVALVLHAMHLLPESYILPLILFLLALHVVHELRGEAKHGEEVNEIRHGIKELKTQFKKIKETEIELIKPEELVSHTKMLGIKNRGIAIWFNICIDMYLSELVFDNVFKPAIESEGTKRIIPIVKKHYKEIWEKEVAPKINSCKGSEKVEKPIFADIRENIAFIMIENERGEKEADISVWGEPFMAEFKIGESEAMRGVPRYIIYIKSNSELIYRLNDIYEKYRRMRY